MALIVLPDKNLRLPCAEVKKFDKNLQKFVIDMSRFMFTGLSWGMPLGLAAPQVGRNIRLFITNEGVNQGGKSGEIRVFINPRIVWTTKAPQQLWQEGCFSLEPGKYNYQVLRHQSIGINYQDISGERFYERFNGQRAQVIQHEIDHLDGILICDKK